MKHLMIDLETLDTKPSSVILSIGAVFFDPETGRVDHEAEGFYRAFDVQEQLNHHRTVSESTMRFWFGASEEARQAWLSAPRIQARQFFVQFTGWVNSVCPDHYDLAVWGHGATFDISMLEDFYRTFAYMGNQLVEVPWRFWNIRDTRTLYDLFPPQKQARKGVYHNALHDALDQAIWVNEAYEKLRALGWTAPHE